MASILEKARSPKWVYDDSGEVIEVILDMTISRPYFKKSLGKQIGRHCPSIYRMPLTPC